MLAKKNTAAMELGRLDAKRTEIAMKGVEARRAKKAKRKALLDLVDQYIARAKLEEK